MSFKRERAKIIRYFCSNNEVNSSPVKLPRTFFLSLSLFLSFSLSLSLFFFLSLSFYFSDQLPKWKKPRKKTCPTTFFWHVYQAANLKHFTRKKERRFFSNICIKLISKPTAATTWTTAKEEDPSKPYSSYFPLKNKTLKFWQVTFKDKTKDAITNYDGFKFFQPLRGPIL